MAQLKSSRNTTKSTRTWLIRGLIAISVLGNITLIALIIAIRYTGQFDYAMYNMFVSRHLDTKGCILSEGRYVITDNQPQPNADEYGMGAQYCLINVIKSPAGAILWPDSLKGQKYPY